MRLPKPPLSLPSRRRRQFVTFGQLDNAIAGVNASIETLAASLAASNQTGAALARRVTTLEKSVADLETHALTLEEGLTTLGRVDADLEERVAALEAIYP
jgi:uncharacterized protein involved in exopolysaccharide biosynthesis